MPVFLHGLYYFFTYTCSLLQCELIATSFTTKMFFRGLLQQRLWSRRFDPLGAYRTRFRFACLHPCSVPTTCSSTTTWAHQVHPYHVHHVRLLPRWFSLCRPSSRCPCPLSLSASVPSSRSRLAFYSTGRPLSLCVYATGPPSPTLDVRAICQSRSLCVPRSLSPWLARAASKTSSVTRCYASKYQLYAFQLGIALTKPSKAFHSSC